MIVNIPIENKSESTLRIMLEPWARVFDINPSEIITLSGLLENFSIEYWNDNFISIWSDSELKVLKDGIIISPIID
jgi:hypothetical protein